MARTRGVSRRQLLKLGVATACAVMVPSALPLGLLGPTAEHPVPAFGGAPDAESKDIRPEPIVPEPARNERGVPRFRE